MTQERERWFVRRMTHGRTTRLEFLTFDQACVDARLHAKRRRFTEAQMQNWTAETQPEPIKIERRVERDGHWRVAADWRVWTGRETLSIDQPTARPIWAWEELEAAANTIGEIL